MLSRVIDIQIRVWGFCEKFILKDFFGELKFDEGENLELALM